ncbi:hypothetical protein GJ699_26605 [Duganella sp. FT80W]|jgi:hypothetical protein|uniref:Uncharacterized protein n=1 Tax=Duganella guangzhouensis TaxID=2666084 RepID=A0A6I2L5Z0_9BURK|nr:hypothetical protein [Duganella guangzhouensis]MRW93568.1 hypothetical protein [Duganella guangzhouensis]
MSTKQTFRPDYQSSEVVEAGIELANKVGPESAAEYLSHRGVLESVIKRVISEPEHRRNPGRLRVRDERSLEEGSRSNKFMP